MPITPDKTMKIEIRTKPEVWTRLIHFANIYIRTDGIVISAITIQMGSATEWVLSNRHNVIHCDEGEDIPLTPEKFLKSVHFTEKIQKELIEYSINKLITNK